MGRNDIARAVYYRSRWINRPAAAWLANRIKTSPNVWYGSREGWPQLVAAVERHDGTKTWGAKVWGGR